MANSDAAGRGVVVALLTTATIATIVVTAHFLLSWLHAARRRSEEGRGVHLQLAQYTNTGSVVRLDPLGTEWHGDDAWTRWLEGLKIIAISLSDQQLVTGLSLLIATWLSYKSSSLDSYHFSLVIQLVIFSTGTHTASLLLRYGSYWTSTPSSTTKIGYFPWISSVFVTTLRVGCIYATVAGLIFAASQPSALAVNVEWSGCPVKCMAGISSTELLISDLGGILPLVGIYVIYLPCYCIPFLHNTSARLVSKVYEMMATLLHRRVPTMNAGYEIDEGIPRPSQRSTYTRLFLKMCLAQLVVVYIGIVIGILGLSKVSKWGSEVLDATQRQAEGQWGFGQIVPVALLLMTLIAVMETLIDYSPDKVTPPDEHNLAVDRGPSPILLHAQQSIVVTATYGK